MIGVVAELGHLSDLDDFDVVGVDRAMIGVAGARRVDGRAVGHIGGARCRSPVGHHQGHGAGGVRQVHELIRTVDRLEIRRDIDGHQAGPLEHLQQAVATVQQFFDLMAGERGAALEVGQDPLAIRARLVDHLAALLLGQRHLGLGVGGRVVALTRHFDLGLLTNPVGLLGRLTNHAGGVLLGTDLDLRGRLTGGVQHPQRLLAQHRGDRLVVEFERLRQSRTGRVQLGFELALALLEPCQFGGDRTQEGPDFVLVVPAPGRGEPRLGH